MEDQKANAAQREHDTIVVPAADTAGIGQLEIEAQDIFYSDINEIGKKRSPFRMFAILAALFLSLFVAALDATIVATAVPTIAAQLHSASGYTWIGGAYLLGNAASGPIWAVSLAAYLLFGSLTLSNRNLATYGAESPSFLWQWVFSLRPLSSVRSLST